MINWTEKIDKKYLYTKGSKKGEPVDLDKVKESDLLVTLGGMVDLLHQRGFEEVSYRLQIVERDYVQAICRIVFSENTVDGQLLPRQVFESTASAKEDNMTDFMKDYLETCAENRALVRCIRRYLNVNIVSDEEINKVSRAEAEAKRKENQPISMESLGPKVRIIRLCDERGFDFDKFVSWLNEIGNKMKPEILAEAAKWNSFDDLSEEAARFLVGVIQTVK